MRSSHRLRTKGFGKRYLNVDLNKEVRNQFIGLSGQAYRDDQIVYGAKDVEYLCKLRKLQLPKIEEFKLTEVVELENRAVLAFSDIEYNGIDIDRDAWEVIARASEQEALSMRDELDNLVLIVPSCRALCYLIFKVTFYSARRTT